MTSVLYEMPSVLYYSTMQLSVELRAHRLARGISQEHLAAVAGISRQAYSAIEKGSAVPSTLVAMKLAKALGTSVETLFRLEEDETAVVEAEPSWRADEAPALGSAVGLYRIDDRWIARPIRGGTSIRRSVTGADGTVAGIDAEGRVTVESFGRMSQGDGIVAVGCDPATPVLASYLQARHVDLTWFDRGSQGALHELAKGHAHVAGCHVYDAASGDHNLPLIRSLLPFPVTVVTFSIWEQGLVVASGNPKRIRGIEDLARPGVAIVNREEGSGSRGLLDRSLASAGMQSGDVAGYNRVAYGHLSVCDAVSAGLADAGVAVRAAAFAAALDFVPLAEERYDLVIPTRFVDAEPIQKMLAALKQPELRRRIEALSGYDVAEMGRERSV